MSISYQAKEPQVFSRQLEVQELNAICNLTAAASGGIPAASSDAPSVFSVGGSLSVRTITIDVAEEIEKCFSVTVINRASGAIVATTALPDTSVANKITVTVDGTGISSAAVCVKYKVQE